MAKPKQLMLTVNEVCDALHASRSTVYRLINDGELRGIDISSGDDRARRHLRVPAVDVERFLNRRDVAG